MINVGDVISYLTMCQEEGVNLQRGMNFRLRNKLSIILMSLRSNAPYADRIENNGEILIYEGHDVPNTKDLTVDPKMLDQPLKTPKGSFTENGKFYQAAQCYKSSREKAELVKVYEKLHPGIWTFNGIFRLVDAWLEYDGRRNVFKFKLKITDQILTAPITQSLEHARIIPTSVKLAVWKRDKGCCVMCGAIDNLHFDHIIPFSKGGTSLLADNIQLLCARHNLEKRDNIL